MTSLAKNPEAPYPAGLKAEPSVGGVGKHEDFHPQNIMDLNNDIIQVSRAISIK
jgi:hypothetical protein